MAAAGHVDVLVANAALSQAGELTSLSPAEVDRVLAVNLRAPVMLARLLAEPMAARRSGQLVFVSSLQGKAAAPLSSLYTATKFGLRGFSLALRLDLADHGVGVSCVFARLRPRRRDVRRLWRAPAAGGRHEHSRGGRRRDRPRDRAQPRRGRRAPLALRAGARIAGGRAGAGRER